MYGLTTTNKTTTTTIEQQQLNNNNNNNNDNDNDNDNDNGNDKDNNNYNNNNNNDNDNDNNNYNNIIYDNINNVNNNNNNRSNLNKYICILCAHLGSIFFMVAEFDERNILQRNGPEHAQHPCSVCYYFYTSIYSQAPKESSELRSIHLALTPYRYCSTTWMQP